MTPEIEALAAQVSTWDGVKAAPHRFGGVEFKLGNVEIGHIHSNGLVDVPLTRKLRTALVNEGEALPHHLLPDTGWISFYIRQPDDSEKAARLLRLSYLHKYARRNRQFDVAAEFELLGYGAQVRTAFLEQTANRT
ncbi:MAG: DUF5519 family protein [Anaerolineae bacterium]|nr:DUF5519 family protein [Anaerolineae bacterium]